MKIYITASTKSVIPKLLALLHGGAKNTLTQISGSSERGISFLLVPLLFSLLVVRPAESASAQDYIGTYHVATPRGEEAQGTFQLRIEIRPTRVITTFGTLKPGRTDITYSSEGNFILAEEDQPARKMYYPIYLYDKDTIYTMGEKLVRVAHDKSNDGASNVGMYEAVASPEVLNDPQHKALWDKFFLRINILPNQVTYTEGDWRHGKCSILPVKKGNVLLATSEKGLQFFPIYILNKDTIFANGLQFIRAVDDKGIEETEK